MEMAGQLCVEINNSLLERADEAMYLAKNAGKGRIIESACEQASESTFDHQAVTA